MKKLIHTTHKRNPTYKQQIMDTPETLKSLFNFQCNFTHVNCIGISNRIVIYHNGGKKLNNEFLTAYINYLLNSTQRYFYDKCIYRSDICFPPLKLMFSYLTPSDDDLYNIVSISPNNNYKNVYEENLIELFKILIGRNIKISQRILIESLEKQHLKLAKYLTNHINAVPHCLELACKLNGTMDIINSMLAQKVQITTTALLNAISSKNEQAVDLLLQYGITPDIRCLSEACYSANRKIINRILMCKVTPTKECFTRLINTCHLGYNKVKESYNSKEVALIIDSLVAHGYILTYDDVFKATQHGCIINDINRFNIKFDNAYIEMCSTIGFYPYDNIAIKPTMKCLYSECQRGNNVQNIKKLISQGVKPDVECLKKACDNTNNLQNIKYLIEVQHIKPDIECLKELAKHIRNNSLTYLLDNFDKDYTNVKPSAEFDDDENIIPDSSGPVQEYDPMSDTIFRGKILESVLNGKPNTDTNKKYKIGKIKPSDKVNMKTKNVVSENAALVLDIKQGTKMTFTELRKALISYIQKNKLIDGTRKDLIKPNPQLAILVGVKKNEYINFKDIDNMVALMF